MASFDQMGTIDIWYARLDEDELLKTMRRAARHAWSTSRSRSSPAGNSLSGRWAKLGSCHRPAGIEECA
jgi:hypothetical protein